MKYFFLLFPLLAAATEYDPGLREEFGQQVQRGKFFKPAETPITPRNFGRAVGASVRIGAKDEACSASLISKDGYVVTAAHCVEKCFKASWGYQPDIRVEWPSKGEKGAVYDGLSVLEQVPARLNCPAYITNNYYIWDFDLTDPKIVWLGRGYLYSDEKELAKLPSSEFAALRELTEDVAILKYEFVGQPRDIPCIPAVETTPAPGAPVWAIGYPVSGPGYDYNGYKEYVSLGQARASIMEDPILSQYAQEVDQSYLAPFWGYQKALWQKDSVFLSNVKAAHGNSGGMIVDENGELAAVLFSTVKASQTYNDSTTMGVSLPYLRKQLRAQFGEAKAAEIFRCPR